MVIFALLYTSLIGMSKNWRIATLQLSLPVTTQTTAHEF